MDENMIDAFGDAADDIQVDPIVLPPRSAKAITAWQSTKIWVAVTIYCASLFGLGAWLFCSFFGG